MRSNKAFRCDDSRVGDQRSQADARTPAMAAAHGVAIACEDTIATTSVARVLLLAALILSGVLSDLCVAQAAPSSNSPIASTSRTTIIIAPPLRRTTPSGPCWQADRPGIVDTIAMAPVVPEILHVVRSAAARSGGLDAIAIAIVGERDDCPARPELRERLGAEIADYFVDSIAVNARTRIFRRYIVELLIEEIGSHPDVYSWDSSIDSLRTVVESIVRSDPRDGDLPVPAVSPDGSASRPRRFAIIIQAAAAAERAPTAASPVASPLPQPMIASLPTAHHDHVEVQDTSPSPRTDKQTTVGVRALGITALGTTHLGGQIEWGRSWSFGLLTARGGIRLGMLASDDEWANGGRLSRSSLGIVGVPVSVGRSVDKYRVYAGIVVSGLIGLTAVRGEVEVGIARLLTPTLSLGVAGGPALTAAPADTHRSDWSSAVCIERILP